MDGEVIIGTRLDTKNLEKELKIAERQLQQYEREAEKLTKQRAEINTKDAEKQLETLNQKITKIKGEIEQIKIETPWKVDLNSASYAIRIKELSKYENERKQILDGINEQYTEIDEKIKTNARNQALVNDKIRQLNGELTKAKGFESIKEHIKDIGKHMDKNVKKIGRWALAIFGIRSAYMMVRQAMSTISKYDKQMATDLEYIRFAIANTLRPLIEGIVELAKKLMFYVGYIAKGWFGIDIYARSSAKDFKKANEEAKKLQKTLAGFDEMDVVNDASSQNDTPSFDLGNMQDMKVPSWLEWISNNGDKVAGILLGIAGGLLAIKTGVGLLKGLAIGLLIFEIVDLIGDVIDYINDPSWENFFKVLGDILEIVGLIMILMGNWGGVIVFLAGLVIEHWEEISKVLGKIAEWIYNNVIKPIGDFFVGLAEVLCAPFQAFIDFVKTIWDTIKEPIKKFVEKINKALEKVNPIRIGIEFFNDLFSSGSSWKDIRKFAEEIKRKGGGSRAKGGIFYPDRLPKLAVGGIINQPGRGIPYNGATIGERGAEAVVPLTDSQQMSLLGEAIGKYININATIPVYVGNRQITRELKKINAENDFAYNR